MSESVEGRPALPGRCEVDGCGRPALFRDERRCAWHPAVTHVVITLADGQRLELPGPPLDPEAA